MKLSINNVAKQFKAKKAVDDISFSMENGFWEAALLTMRLIVVEKYCIILTIHFLA